MTARLLLWAATISFAVLALLWLVDKWGAVAGGAAWATVLATCFPPGSVFKPPR